MEIKAKIVTDTEREMLRDTAGIYLNSLDGQSVKYIAEDKMSYGMLAKQIADSDFYAPSSGVPAWMTTIWTQRYIEQLLTKTAFKEVSSPFKQGDFETNSVTLPTVEYTGETAPYGDYSLAGQSGYNAKFPERDVYRFQTLIQWGALEVATMALAKLNAVAVKHEAAAKRIAQDFDIFGFLGVAGTNIYGLLNNPDLASAIVVPASAANPASSKWKYKTPNEIIDDVSLGVEDVISRSGGQVTQMSKMRLVAAPQDLQYLSTKATQAFLKPAIEFLKSAFPNMDITASTRYVVGSGQGTGANGNKAQIIIEPDTAMMPNVNDMFTFQYMSFGVVKRESYFSEKAAAGTAGCFLAYPFAMSTLAGV